MEQHQKHAKLTRPAYGTFHRNEWAIVGTPCSNIQQLASELTKRLSTKYRMAYVDADHKSADIAAANGPDRNSPFTNGATLEYTDKINYHRFDSAQPMDAYQYRRYFQQEDLVLVNGNHFAAKQQIVVIDPKKEKSLQKRLDQLTDIQLILLAEPGLQLYPFLQDQLQGLPLPTVLQLNDVNGIADFLAQQMNQRLPVLNGLVLAGGKSRRMGQDKGLIDYHGKPQREYMADLLQPLCNEVYISCRPDQVAEVEPANRALPDTFEGLGPFGAILSAFREQPEAAWLVVACDLPLLDHSTLQQLKRTRNPSKLATAFNSPVNAFPEPLIAIWEPRAYPELLQFLAQGYSCPRKVLINTMVELIDAAEPAALSNINEPKEYEAIMARLTKA